jgi:hypothetical protein
MSLNFRIQRLIHSVKCCCEDQTSSDNTLATSDGTELCNGRRKLNVSSGDVTKVAGEIYFV